MKFDIRVLFRFVEILCLFKVCSSQKEIFDIYNAVLQRESNNYADDFNETNTNIEADQKCQQDLQEFIQKLTVEKWALEMADASGKLTSGIIRGNLNSFGSFEECLSINHVNISSNISIQGKYCLASIPLVLLTDLINLANLSFYEDQKMLNLSSVQYNIGICLPSSCSSQGLEEFISNLMESQLNIRDVFIHFEENKCYSKNSSPWKPEDWAAVGILFLAILFVLSCTLYDIWFTFYSRHQKEKNKILVSFSFYTNTLKLLKVTSPGKLSSLHGIRVLSILWIVLEHGLYIRGDNALENFLDYKDWSGSLSSSLVSGEYIAVDTFFILSGLLLSYVFFEKYKEGDGFNVFSFYFHRFLRLTPAFAILVLFYATLLKHMGSGPAWFKINKMSEFCIKNWWSSLLYIQNYVNIREMCVFHGWYLAVDMQLYVLSPLLIIPMMLKPKAGIVWTAFCTFLSIFIVIILSIENKWKAANSTHYYYYFQTHTRASPWLIGFLSGYLLVKSRKALILNKFVITIGWVCCLAIIGAVLLGKPFIESYLENVTYLGLTKPAWALAVLWIIITCYYGYGGPVNWFLSLGIFQILARLTYSIYLIHLAMQMTMSYSRKVPTTFSIPKALHTYIGDIGVCIILAYFFYLVFELPIINLERLLLQKGKNEQTDKESPDQEETVSTQKTR